MPVVLQDHDPSWPNQVEAQARSIRAVQGAMALAVDHLGSTSVPGLPAKPIRARTEVVEEIIARRTQARR